MLSLKVTFSELRTIVAQNDKQRFSLIPKSSLKQTSTTVPDDDAATAATGDDPSVVFQATGANDMSDISDDPVDFLIRANQGHSLSVDTEGLLEPINLANAPALCVHGTTHHAWPLILESGGLKRMTRTHVHFAAGLPEGMQMLPDDKNTNQSEGTEGSAGSSVQPRAAPVISGMRSTSSILIYIDLSSALSSGLQFFRSENGVLLSAGDNETGIIPSKFFKRVEERTEGLGVLMRNGEVVQEPPARWRSRSTGGRNKSKR
ncbi:MAG: hypothetical protein M1822_000580 [Bathelium mastoideum]|nr:MAG: hypothetical protein M1822_000580 [Bathelium mastoideum]